MSNIPEHRCPVCAALYNVEACDRGVHLSYNTKMAERARIVERIREAARHPMTIYKSVFEEIADCIETDDWT